MEAERPRSLRDALHEIASWQNSDSNRRLRRFTRYPVRAEGYLRPASEAPSSWQMVHVLDISRGGVGVLCDSTITPGTMWTFELRCENLILSTFSAFCRHTRSINNDAYLVGLQFGLDAAPLLALGVSTKDVSCNEMPEELDVLGEIFTGPDAD